MQNADVTPDSPSPENMYLPLRMVLVLDAAVLLLLGMLFIFLPNVTAMGFGFRHLPVPVHYIISLWGCVMATLSIGYVQAAINPLRNIAWIQVGIARGLLELAVGLFYVLRGLLPWHQAAFGVVTAAVITVAYVGLYPRVRPVP